MEGGQASSRRKTVFLCLFVTFTVRSMYIISKGKGQRKGETIEKLLLLKKVVLSEHVDCRIISRGKYAHIYYLLMKSIDMHNASMTP